MTFTPQTPQEHTMLAHAQAYVRSRFFPPLPSEYGGLGIEALAAVNSGEPERVITFACDLNPQPRGTVEVDDNHNGVAASTLVDVLRLWHLVEDDETDTFHPIETPEV